jgi:hypothetical protein
MLAKLLKTVSGETKRGGTGRPGFVGPRTSVPVVPRRADSPAKARPPMRSYVIAVDNFG